jgi:hypothetical protein
MRRLLVALVILAFAVPAFAGLNPGVRAFISMTAPAVTNPYVHQVAYTGEKTYNTYFLIDCLGNTLPPPDPALLGARTVSFKWVTTPSDPAYPPDVMAALYYPVGSQVIGGPDQPIGWVIAWPDCMAPTAAGFIRVLRQGYYCYNPLNIDILPNTTDGKMVVDCLFGADQFCVLSNGGIGVAPNPGDPGCTCPPPGSAVESTSWGNIKALYR